ncbi:MAG: ABC transporter permease [Planctomycetota bacterium]
MLLPWEYGVRNLSRRPIRTALTLIALATVVMLVLVVVGFIRGIQRSLSISGDENVVLVHSVSSEENIENSAIDARTPALLTASVDGTWTRFRQPHVSPELYLGSRVATSTGHLGLGLIRGVTPKAPLVRRTVRLHQGSWPDTGEVMIGRLAAAKLGASSEATEIGQRVDFEGRTWTISGIFSADGAAYESEIWCNLPELQTATKRQDLSLVAVLLEPRGSHAAVSLFCKERTDLELRAIRETDYYSVLQQHYQPVRLLAWTVVVLVSSAGVFAGMNMMYGAVAGRIREIATLQAIGFRRRAIALSLIQEGVLLASAACLLSSGLALITFDGMAIRFTMGAFALHIDSVAIIFGCGVGLLLGVVGALPPALKALRESVAISLKSV